MIAKTSSNKQIKLTNLTPADYSKLAGYLQQLSAATKKRFGPHLFDEQSIIDFYKNAGDITGYTAYDIETEKMIAYAVIKTGYLLHDSTRLQSYGLSLSNKTDCTLAPSVADAWQGCGVGNALFQYILPQLKHAGILRIILWGGVQADNERAVNYYTKNGFKILGSFDCNGLNYDMVLDIH
jgi:diamine N-acetyltransferase